MFTFLKSKKTEIIVLFILVALSAITHGYNMFHFPYYENDEGSYYSRAWSLITMGRMDPYTYWYDHSPAGWLFMALWALVSGGFFTFGFSINSGRVFILILHVLSVIFLFKSSKNLFKSIVPGTIAVLFFSLSPLGDFRK